MEAASASYLPDDVVVEILARLPVKSLCRFKCVSRTWRRLISNPVHRHRFLSGLICYRGRGHGPHPPCFAGLHAPLPPPPGVADTALSLPPSCAEMELLDSCNGLLLLRSSRPAGFYMVCNPANGDWVTLPPPSHAPGETSYDDENTCVAALGFDPAASPHFYVFQLVEKKYQFIDFVVAVEIYSSEAGGWILRESGWSKEESTACNLQLTYLNGFLHFALLYDAVASVDTEGQTWGVTHVRQERDEPNESGYGGFVGHSQGRLLYADVNPNDDSIPIFVLEDHDSCWEWTFKHSVSKLDLIPLTESPHGPCFNVAALHADADLIYFYDWTQETLISYDMTRGVVHVICTLREVSHAHRPFLPYVPFYSRPLASSSAG